MISSNDPSRKYDNSTESQPQNRAKSTFICWPLKVYASGARQNSPRLTYQAGAIQRSHPLTELKPIGATPTNMSRLTALVSGAQRKGRGDFFIMDTSEASLARSSSWKHLAAIQRE